MMPPWFDMRSRVVVSDQALALEVLGQVEENGARCFTRDHGGEEKQVHRGMRTFSLAQKTRIRERGCEAVMARQQWKRCHVVTPVKYLAVDKALMDKVTSTK